MHSTIKLFQFIVSVVLASLLFSSAFGATYYVRYQTGSDANNGTTTGTPFKRCPGDYRSTGTAASTTLTAGDIVYFYGGEDYDATRTNAICISLTWSGTPGSPITYAGGQLVGFGSGMPSFTDFHHYYGANEIGTTVFGNTSSRSNHVFTGLKFFELGGSATPPVDPGVATNRNTGAGFNYAGGARNIYITGCDFGEIGYYWNVKPMDENAISGLAAQFINIDGGTVSNCNFSKMNIALELFGDTSGLVTNFTLVSCSFSNSMKWIVDLAGLSNSKFGAINISKCQFRDFGDFGQATWTGYGEWPHVDSIFLRRDSSGMQYSTNRDSTGINFFSNTFIETNNAGANGTACIYITAGPSANVYNNKFITTKKSRTIYVNGAHVAGVTPQVVRIYNNTFFEDFQNAIDLASNSGGGSIKSQEIDIRNNVLYDMRTGASDNTIMYFQVVSPATNFTVNYNQYYSFNTAGDWFKWDGVGTGGLALLQANSLEANGLFSNPVFVDASFGDGYDSYLNNLALQSSSPSRDTAQTISFFSSDILDVSRPQGPAWDRGAFEFVQTIFPNIPRPYKKIKGVNLRP